MILSISKDSAASTTAQKDLSSIDTSTLYSGLHSNEP